MNGKSLLFTLIVAIVAFLIMLQLIKFISKRKKILLEHSEKLSVSYALWVGTLLLSFVLYLQIALKQIEYSIEVFLSSKVEENIFLASIEKIAVFIGLTITSTLLSYYLTHFIFNLIYQKRTESYEMENNHIGYFLIKGIGMVTFVIATLSIFEHFLMWFLPEVETPFFK